MIDSKYISLPEIMKTITAMGMTGFSEEMIGAGMQFQQIRHKVQDGVLMFDRAQALKSLMALGDCWNQSKKMLEGKTETEVDLLCRIGVLETKLVLLGRVMEKLLHKLGDEE